MKIIFSLFLLFFFFPAFSTTTREKQTSLYFDSIKNDEKKLFYFINEMPKGADLHHHLGGSALPENLLSYTKNDNICINKKTFQAFISSYCLKENLLNNAIKDIRFYNNLIASWSMYHFTSDNTSGHVHFFAVFEKIDAITNLHHAEIIADAKQRAAQENEVYIEMMI